MVPRYPFAFVLQACLCTSTIAKPVEEKREADDFSSIAESVFSAFFTETEAEKKKLSAIPISRREEIRLGKSHLERFLDSLKRRGYCTAHKGEDVEYLNALAREIKPLMRNADRYPTIDIYVAKMKTTDAIAFPGGYVVCSTGMLNFARSEAALVGVLAHELSHIDRGHQLRLVRTRKFAEDSLMFTGSPFEQLIQSGKLLAKQFARPYRPEEEAAADLDAAKWMVKLGYDPAELAAVFHRLHRRDQVGRVRIPSFLRTHPYHIERYWAVKQYSSRLKVSRPNEKLYVGCENLECRVARSERAFEE